VSGRGREGQMAVGRDVCGTTDRPACGPNRVWGDVF